MLFSTNIYPPLKITWNDDDDDDDDEVGRDWKSLPHLFSCVSQLSNKLTATSSYQLGGKISDAQIYQ